MLLSQKDLSPGEYYQVSVIATGIKKRCRKSAFESDELGFIPRTDPDENLTATLLDLAKSWVQEKMKSVTSARIELYRAEYDGTFISLHLGLDGRNQKFPLEV